MERLDWIEKYVIGCFLSRMLDVAHGDEGTAIAEIAYSIADKLDCREALEAHAQHLGRIDALRATATTLRK
jgi:hypothetical protein